MTEKIKSSSKSKTDYDANTNHYSNEEYRVKNAETVHGINAISSEFSGSSGINRLKVNSMQDSFLNNCRHDHTVVEIFLTGNIIDTGKIVGFDVNTIIMEYDDKSQYLIMKAAIIKIIPKNSVNYIFNDNYKCPNYIADYSGDEKVGG